MYSNFAKMKNEYAKEGRIDAYNPMDLLRKCCDAVGNSKQDRSIDWGHNLVKTSHALKLVDDVAERKQRIPCLLHPPFQISRFSFSR